MCECVSDLFLFLSSLCPCTFVCCFSFVIQTSVYDRIYMNTVTMIVMSVCVNVCAGFRQITLIKDTDDTVLLMIVCPFV